VTAEENEKGQGQEGEWRSEQSKACHSSGLRWDCGKSGQRQDGGPSPQAVHGDS